jgi:hypothetical protein
MKRRHCLSSVGAAALAAIAVGCGSDEKPKPIPEGGLSIQVCDPAAGPFSTNIDNPYLPMPVGMLQVLSGTDEGVALRVEIRALDQTEVVAGVTTRVVEERELEGSELVEVSRNFFAQAGDGTVCYFGEDVDVYSDGAVSGHPGQWRADGAAVKPGIVMPGAPSVGAFYSQEVAPGVALDRAEIVAMGEVVTVPAGTFTDTIRTREWTPLEPDDEEFKAYARGIGLIVDADVRLEP